MKTRFYLLLGLLWIILGLIVGVPAVLPFFSETKQPISVVHAIDTSTAVKDETPLISGEPTHIAFPRLNISVDVAPGYYDAKSNSWTLSKDKAHFATVTSQPNNKTGNTFIYGHNRWQVFTGLLSAQIGDQAIVTTANGHTFTYTLAAINDTNPYDMSYMETHQSPILTVQTCSGLWYEHRRMFTFNLSEVN